MASRCLIVFFLTLQFLKKITHTILKIQLKIRKIIITLTCIFSYSCRINTICIAMSLSSVLPKIVSCKEELSDAIRDCPSYTGFLELVNKMHRLLVAHYCKNNAVDFMSEHLGTGIFDISKVISFNN